MAFAYKVGHDAEFFVQKEGTIIPVCGLVGGTKAKPLKVPRSKVGTTYQEDGAALELGMEPCAAHEFRFRAYDSFLEGQAFAAKRGLDLVLASSHEFSSELLAAAPEASVLGCSPDFNAWERGHRRPIMDVTTMKNTRFTGGHLHFSYDVDNVKVPTWAIVQMLDALALPFWENYNAKEQGARYEFYGKPGLYRPKPYGLEYRTPHNSWIMGSSSSTAFVTRCATVVRACAELSNADVRGFYDRIDWQAVATLLDFRVTPTHSMRRTQPVYTQLYEIFNQLSREVGGL